MTNIPAKTRLPIKARMVLTAPQYSQIAATYEHAAADWTLPPQPRAAFAMKASWFRMRAQKNNSETGVGATAERVSSYGAATLSSFSRNGHLESNTLSHPKKTRSA